MRISDWSSDVCSSDLEDGNGCAQTMKRPGALRYSFLGLDFDGLDALAAAKKIVALAREGRFSYIVTPHVDHLVQLDRSNDPAIALAHRDAELSLCASRNLPHLARRPGIVYPVVTGRDLPPH